MSDEQGPRLGLDAGYWAQRYRYGETGWDLSGPTPALSYLLTRGLFPVEPPAFILVPGCGYGHDALSLTAKGYSVTALDWVSEPLSALQARAPQNLHTLCTDFFAYADTTPYTYEAIWEYTFYCAIDPVQRPPYFAAVSKLLKKGGYWVALLFPLGSQPYEAGPPFALSWEEVQTLAYGQGLSLVRAFVEAPSHPARQGRELLVSFKKEA